MWKLSFVVIEKDRVNGDVWVMINDLRFEEFKNYREVRFEV